MVNGIACLTKLNKFHNRWQTVVFYSFEDSSQCQHLRNGRSTRAKAILIVQYRRHGSIIGRMQFSNILLFSLATTDVKLIPLQFPVSLKLRDQDGELVLFLPYYPQFVGKKNNVVDLGHYAIISRCFTFAYLLLGILQFLHCVFSLYYFNVMQNRVNVTQRCVFKGGSQQVLEMLIPLLFPFFRGFPTIFQTLLLYDWLLY